VVWNNVTWCLLIDWSVAPPTISEGDASPNNISVLAGRSAVIVCPAAGTPAPQITWFKDDAEVVPGESSDVRVLSNGRRLEINHVELEHAGLYRCLAKNIAGHVDREFQLHVLGLYTTRTVVLLGRPCTVVTGGLIKCS